MLWTPRHYRTAWRWVLGCALLWLGCGAARAAPVVVLQVQDAIGPASADYVVRGIAKAQQAGATLVVLELDTPGGLDSAMRQIIQAILASPVPVATWVAPEGARAASAGTYILYASHIAAMAPATTLGAATPVSIGMPTPEPKAPASKPAASAPPPDTMTAKAVHDAAAFIRGLAQQRGRNAEWAERAVREAVSLTSAEALREKVVDIVARDVPDLLAQIDGRTVRLPAGDVVLHTRGLAHERALPGWRHRLLSVIANPSFALILMMIGIYGLMFEFSSPGFAVPGVVGAICLLLGLFALQLLPVNYAGLALVLLGMGLMAAEAFAPAFGVLGVGGVIAFIAGGILLFDADVPGYGVPLPLLIGLALLSAGVVVLGGGMALRARHRPVVSGREELAGADGQVVEVHGDEAWAMVRGERWRVRADSPLAPGQPVRVVALNGLTLDVTPSSKEGATR
jgi:membrane-bound serine protease (ClpP class)